MSAERTILSPTGDTLWRTTVWGFYIYLSYFIFLVIGFLFFKKKTDVCERPSCCFCQSDDLFLVPFYSDLFCMFPSDWHKQTNQCFVFFPFLFFFPSVDVYDEHEAVDTSSAYYTLLHSTSSSSAASASVATTNTSAAASSSFSSATFDSIFQQQQQQQQQSGSAIPTMTTLQALLQQHQHQATVPLPLSLEDELLHFCKEHGIEDIARHSGLIQSVHDDDGESPVVLPDQTAAGMPLGLFLIYLSSSRALFSSASLLCLLVLSSCPLLSV